MLYIYVLIIISSNTSIISTYISVYWLSVYSVALNHNFKKSFPYAIIPAYGTVKKIVRILSCSVASSIRLLFPSVAKTFVNAEEKIFENTPRALLNASGICLASDKRPIITLLINQLLNNKSSPFSKRLLIFIINFISNFRLSA